MSKTAKIFVAGLIILILGAGLVYTGIWIGRFGLNPFTPRGNSHGWGMMSGWGTGFCVRSDYSGGSGMMGGIYDQEFKGDPLSIHEVEEILSGYLNDLGDQNLFVSDVMIFANHAYAQILEESTGIGAMEVLIDYETQGVYPEQGPNMMWNIKYGHMSDGGNFHGSGMMSGYGAANAYQEVDLDNFGEMPISASEAISAAQDYLDRYSPGYKSDDHVVMFYGYYTLHVLDGSDVISMLSVNGFTSKVFYHSWHGDLLETDEH